MKFYRIISGAKPGGYHHFKLGEVVEKTASQTYKGTLQQPHSRAGQSDTQIVYDRDIEYIGEILEEPQFIFEL